MSTRLEGGCLDDSLREFVSRTDVQTLVRSYIAKLIQISGEHAEQERGDFVITSGDVDYAIMTIGTTSHGFDRK